MFDRASFWSSVPEWATARLEAGRLSVSVRGHATLWLVGGNTALFLDRQGLARALGPRDCPDVDTYALRLAPDRLLFVSDEQHAGAFGWTAEGCAISDMCDGFLCIELTGDGASAVLARASEYPFESPPGSMHESAQMLVAGLRVIVARRTEGWRLFVERPWAAALWRWLEQNLE